MKEEKKSQNQVQKPVSDSKKDPKTDGEPAQRIEELEQANKELTDQIKRLTEVASRAQAELQNAKIRMEKESTELRKYASATVFINLIPTIDNLQRALKHLPKELEKDGGIPKEFLEWTKGIVVLEQQFLKQVGEMGLRRFESLGKPVDHERHEILMAVPGEAGKVIEVIEDGYELHGKVLRPAKVKVGEEMK
ncbi:nucleotide exchange factor GrpE [Candidatus Peribacteria bacterium RIFCSPLOWO2_01_FULL_51_18]|nr:MAG: nucleotide exchange factor GrpE [Candidatus Peribacteria bacterium RIFCSPHIGHO2_02_FULL_51_15]OGJ65942.1 MAG: nucleotide exchange factor GrpE [Candidatus Peribacteria bacterium RIFCSPLOWO2_01_FULL_51_18]OGJ68966.1 MAG: nucleotide exchange factor GrpE [Candidatus Peribacteria bacterium RIFCSPLOWO2_02_FULL_51_10]